MGNTPGQPLQPVRNLDYKISLNEKDIYPQIVTQGPNINHQLSVTIP
jgi:hypothetical protein